MTNYLNAGFYTSPAANDFGGSLASVSILFSNLVNWLLFYVIYVPGVHLVLFEVNSRAVSTWNGLINADVAKVWAPGDECFIDIFIFFKSADLGVIYGVNLELFYFFIYISFTELFGLIFSDIKSFGSKLSMSDGTLYGRFKLYSVYDGGNYYFLDSYSVVAHFFTFLLCFLRRCLSLSFSSFTGVVESPIYIAASCFWVMPVSFTFYGD